jgi:uncharacterized metal-binding protein
MDKILPLPLRQAIPAPHPNGRALVFVCSGAADVGELTDRAARRLHQEGGIAMSCLASIGARDPDIMFNTDLADQVLLIDGCPNACAWRTFQEAGIPVQRFLHFDLAAVGLFKGASPMTPERLHLVTEHARRLLHADKLSGATLPPAAQE